MHNVLYLSDGEVRKVTSLDEVSDLAARREGILWLDFEDPDERELDRLGRKLGFHRLSIEDAYRGRQRPKIDRYEDYSFIVMYSASYQKPVERGTGGFKFSQVGIFVGRNYAVTVHREHVPELDEAIRRWKENPQMVRGSAVGFVLYFICDSIVDNYFPLMDAIGEVIDEIEEKVFVAFSREAVSDIFALRKDMLALRKVVGPERDVLNVLARRELPMLDGSIDVFFADVYDHLVRVTDMIETYHDLLSGALDGYLSMTSNNLNEIVKVLTSASIILMSATLIAGIYGMNFRYMPELGWDLGYPWAIGLMALVSVVLFALFRLKRWL